MCQAPEPRPMGYACPVCDAPQADAEHLANHLAFTAMLHGDDHAEFLDARVDGWEDKTPPELAIEVLPHADEAEYDEVFEDTTDGAGMGAEPPGGGEPADLDALAGEGAMDAETERAIEEARKLFERGEDAEE